MTHGSSLREQLQETREAGRAVLVLGLGVSGVSTAECLLGLGVTPLCIERVSEADFRKNSKFVARVDALLAGGARIVFGCDGEAIGQYLAEVDLAVLSPGVSPESAAFGALRRAGTRYISELELGMALHGGPSVVVTGSNGKSTTVTLIEAILRAAGLKSFLCGNVGVPVVSADAGKDLSANGEYLVVEASSYQLETSTLMVPRAAVVLNVAENHLERHGTIARYAAAKFRIADRQGPEDLLVLNADDSIVRPLGSRVRSAVGYFSFGDTSAIPSGAACSALVRPHAKVVEVRPPAGRSPFSVSLATTRLFGAHNAANVAAAALVASFLGCSPDAIQSAVDGFLPLEHRIEEVFPDRPQQGRTLVFNDSKSTTVAASVAAVTTVSTAYPDRRIVIMLGGLSKAGSWQPLLSAVKGVANVDRAVCFGKDGGLIAEHLRGGEVECSVVPTLADGVALAKSFATPESVVLLSPGCASFDEFRDFEGRGAAFKQLVRELF